MAAAWLPFPAVLPQLRTGVGQFEEIALYRSSKQKRFDANLFLKIFLEAEVHSANRNRLP